MPEYTLQIDREGADLLALQEQDTEHQRAYYLLRGNPAVRVVTRGGLVENCVDHTLAVLAGREECWGQWQRNRHLRGRRTFVVTVFGGDERDAAAAETLSAWLRRHYLSEGGMFYQVDGTPRGGKR